MSENYSLKSKIRVAESSAAIKALLQEGRNFDYATEKTRRQWDVVAQRRLESFAKKK